MFAICWEIPTMMSWVIIYFACIYNRKCDELACYWEIHTMMSWYNFVPIISINRTVEY